MKLRPIPSLAAALALSFFPATVLRAATVDELVASLRVEVEKSLAESKTNKNSGSSIAYEAERLMSQLESGLARENFETVEQTLNQLAVARLNIEAKQRISELQREVPKAAEERQKAFVAQVGAAIEKAGKACLAAKTESDLDPIVAELGTLKKQRADGTYNESRQRLNTRLDGAIRFVNRWQDHLVQVARGYDATARTVLRELADPNSSQYYPILPRTEIVARLGQEKERTPEEVIAQMKTLDELPKTITELTRLSRENSGRSSGNFEFSSPLNELTQIARAHAAFKAGNYGSALLTAAQWEGAGGVRSPESMRLKTMLTLAVLPRYLELPDNPQPKAGENPSDFLLRLAAEGVEKNDWPRVARSLDAYRITAFASRNPPIWIQSELEACQQFVAGQNLEKVGRFVPAILAYQRAVRVSGKYSPQKAATERLAALAKEQPAEFAEAGKEPQLREVLDALQTPGAPGAVNRSLLNAPAFPQ